MTACKAESFGDSTVLTHSAEAKETQVSQIADEKCTYP